MWIVIAACLIKLESMANESGNHSVSFVQSFARKGFLLFWTLVIGIFASASLKDAFSPSSFVNSQDIVGVPDVYAQGSKDLDPACSGGGDGSGGGGCSDGSSGP